MTPAVYQNLNISIAQGPPATLYIPVHDESGTLLPLSGFTFTAKLADWSGVVVDTFTAVAGTEPDTGSSVLVLTLSAAKTAALLVGIYRWDCIGTLSSVAYPLYYGECVVLDCLSV